MNSTTNISLNDRFTIFQTTKPSSAAPAKNNVRARSRSRSVSNRPVQQQQNGSLRNKRFIDQLEKKHKMRLALKLKNKGALAGRKRLGQPQTNQAVLRRSAPTTANNGNRKKLRRSNSLSNVANRKLSGTPALRRSNSSSNLASRLGVRNKQPQQLAQPRRARALQRQQHGLAPTRSNSRGGNQNRANSRARANSRTNLSRSNSQNNLRRSNSQPKLQLAPTRLKLNRNNFRSDNLNNGNNNGNKLNLKRANSRQRQSINNRLGNNRTNAPTKKQRMNNQANIQPKSGIIRGRVAKRNQGNPKNGNLATNGGRVGGRQLKRGAEQMRGQRSRSRNRRNVNQPAQQKQKPANGRGGNARGGRAAGPRGRSRSRNATAKPIRGAGGQPKKEDLDKELDQYMSTQKTMDI